MLARVANWVLCRFATMFGSLNNYLRPVRTKTNLVSRLPKAPLRLIFLTCETPILGKKVSSSREKHFSFINLWAGRKAKNFSKQREKTIPKDEVEEHWGGPDAFKLILFLKDDFEVQLKKNQSVLVFFSAAWCSHCRQLRKPFGAAALMSKEANLPMVFATYDINQNPDFAQEKGVVGIPLIKYYKNGKFITNYKGKRTSAELFEFAKNPPNATVSPTKIDF